MNKYIDAVLIEMEKMISKFSVTSVPSVYIGGGTPSVLGAAGIGRLLRGIASLLPQTPRHLSQQKPIEFTVEANPESADGAFLAACRDGGVNRISLGVQSFCDASRRLVHRAGDASLIPERLALVSEVFGSNFSADLIAGLPAQGETVLLRDIEKLLVYKPAHVSLYALTAEEGTPLGEDRRFKQILPPADEADQLWIAGRDALEQAGYGQYEVSNFALPGKRSIHNIRYWRMENWLGLGAAASGTIIDDEAEGVWIPAGTGRRFTYPTDAGPWVDIKAEGPIPVDIEELDRLTLMKEIFLMGFRYVEGPDPALFEKRFGITLEAAIPRTLARWRGMGLLQTDRIALSKGGLLLLDPFLIDAFGEVENDIE
jgi:oxygen-independent coproporphyrinogen-3 oxidase